MAGRAGVPDLVPRKCRHDLAKIGRAEEMILAGAKLKAVSRATGIPYQTLRWYVEGNWPRGYVEAKAGGIVPKPKLRSARHYVPIWEEECQT